MAIIWWPLFGLCVGLLARMLYPGKQSIGFFATMVLGVLGSLIGGSITFLFGHDVEHGLFQSSGWIMSIAGAMILIWAGIFMGKQKNLTST